MQLPDFFDAAPRLQLHDPLAAFLGAARDGVLDYGYADVVKLAGHSCPTVASAFLLTRAALAVLYPGALAERGALRVQFSGARLDGVNGVFASVVSLLTGATEDGGFKGLGGRFDRRRLLEFEADIAGQMRVTRLDTGATVDAWARLEQVPGNARAFELLPLCLAGKASVEEVEQFRALWQQRVRMLLTQHADDPAVFETRH
ncbi:MAG: hypothetical protein ABI567_10085 [Gammaproteobacteria bacterium]